MFDRSKKVGKYFFSMPQKALGIGQISQNYKLIKQRYGLLKAPICPYCYQAIMILDTSSEGIRRTFEVENSGGDIENVTIDLYKWRCLNPNCESEEYLPESKSEAKDWAKEMHSAMVAEQITELSTDELSLYAKTHKIYSRIFYFASFVCFVYLIYLIAFTKTEIIRTFITYICVSTAFFANGMRRSYRFWQAQNRIIFKEKAFKEWFQSGKWFV